MWLVVLQRRITAVAGFIAENAYYFMLALAVILLGVSELRFFEPHPHWQIFVKEVAFALLIAMLFGFTVERYQREEFVKLVNKERDDLKRDIFVYAYGHEIGDQIREAMKAEILKCPFQKEDLRIDWEFSEIPGRSEHILVKKRQLYTLTNTTPSKQNYQFKFTQFSASEQDVLVSKVFECLKVQTSKEGQQFKEGQLSFDGHAPHESTLSKDFDLGPNERIEVFFCHRETRRKFGDDNWESVHPVVGLTEVKIVVNPPLQLDISVAAKGKPLDTTAENEPPHRFAFSIKEGLSPHQGLAFSWSPARTKEENKKTLKGETAGPVEA
jgi:hypothetical protein